MVEERTRAMRAGAAYLLILTTLLTAVAMPVAGQVQIKPNPRDPKRKLIVLPQRTFVATRTELRENLLDLPGYKRAAVPFKPFPRQSRSGKPLDPNRPVRLPNGKTITAKEFFDQADLMEQELNKRGRSFRDADPFADLDRLARRGVRAQKVELPDNLNEITAAEFNQRRLKAENMQLGSTSGSPGGGGLPWLKLNPNFMAGLESIFATVKGSSFDAPLLSVQTASAPPVWGEVSPIRNGNFSFLIRVPKSTQPKITVLNWTVTQKAVPDYSTTAGDVLKAGMVKSGVVNVSWLPAGPDPSVTDAKYYAYARVDLNFDDIAKQPSEVLQTYHVRFRAQGNGYVSTPSRSVKIFYGKPYVNQTIVQTYDQSFETALSAAESMTLPFPVESGGLNRVAQVSNFRECLEMNDTDFASKLISRVGTTGGLLGDKQVPLQFTCSDYRIPQVQGLRSKYRPYPVEQTATIGFPDKYPAPIKFVFGRFVEAEKLGKVKQLIWQVTNQTNFANTNADKPLGLVKTGTIAVPALKPTIPHETRYGGIAGELDYWDFSLDMKATVPEPQLDQKVDYFVRVIPVLTDGTKLPPSAEAIVTYHNNNKEYDVQSVNAEGGYKFNLPNAENTPFGVYANSEGLRTTKSERVTRQGNVPIGYSARANAVLGFRHYNMANIIGQQPVSLPKEVLNLDFRAVAGIATGQNQENEEQGARLIVNSFLMPKAETIWLTPQGPALGNGQYSLNYDLSQEIGFTVFDTVVPIGPVPLRITAEVTGSYGAHIYGTLDAVNMNINGSIVPFVRVGMKGRAEATILVAAAGAELAVDIFNADAVFAYEGGAKGKLDVSGNLSALKGKLYLYVKFYYPCLDWEEDFVCSKTLPYTIFQMNDYAFTQPFGN